MMRMRKFYFLTILSLFFSALLNAQSDFPIKIQYDFVRYDKNKFLFPGNTASFDKLFRKLDTLLLFGTNKIRVVQIGASHTQADVFTARLRQRLQNIYPGLNAGRGYVFPYNLIRTNSPYSYKAYHTGEWHVCRNVEKKECLLGVTGIRATTYDSTATITIKLRNDREKFSFNFIRILHSSDSCSFLPVLKNYDSSSIKIIRHFDEGYTDFFLNDYDTAFTLALDKNNPCQKSFTLYGIFLEDTNPGIVFDPIGINGAGTYSYNKCALFTQQLKIINPDWIIIALGTNDGYMYSSAFKEDVFEENYRTLIHKIKAAKPDVAITLVVPNDDYYRRRYPNPNTEKEMKIILKLAKEENCAVWNMYEIMGGYNSSVLWQKYGLMQYDKIHFTKPGYEHLADLFFVAFINAYGEYANK